MPQVPIRRPLGELDVGEAGRFSNMDDTPRFVFNVENTVQTYTRG
jgi:hypothetical protein